MKKSLPYIIAFLAGLFARTAIAALNGWEGYSMNGVDLICGLTCIVMVWSFKGAFLPKKGRRTSQNAVQQSNDRQGR